MILFQTGQYYTSKYTIHKHTYYTTIRDIFPNNKYPPTVQFALEVTHICEYHQL